MMAPRFRCFRYAAINFALPLVQEVLKLRSMQFGEGSSCRSCSFVLSLLVKSAYAHEVCGDPPTWDIPIQDQQKIAGNLCCRGSLDRLPLRSPICVKTTLPVTWYGL